MTTLSHDVADDDQELAEYLIEVDTMLTDIRTRLEQTARQHSEIMHMLARRIVLRLSDQDPDELSAEIITALGGDFARTTLLVEAERMGALPGGIASVAGMVEVSEGHTVLIKRIEAVTP